MCLQKKRSWAEAIRHLLSHHMLLLTQYQILEPNLSAYFIVYSFSDRYRQADVKYFQMEAERVLNGSQCWHRLKVCIISKVSRAPGFLQSSNITVCFPLSASHSHWPSRFFKVLASANKLIKTAQECGSLKKNTRSRAESSLPVILEKVCFRQKGKSLVFISFLRTQ